MFADLGVLLVQGSQSASTQDVLRLVEFGLNAFKPFDCGLARDGSPSNRK